MHSTEQALTYKEEWQVAVIVSTMKSCRSSAIIGYKVLTLGNITFWIVFSPVNIHCAGFIASGVQKSIRSNLSLGILYRIMHSH